MCVCVLSRVVQITTATRRLVILNGDLDIHSKQLHPNISPGQIPRKTFPQTNPGHFLHISPQRISGTISRRCPWHVSYVWLCTVNLHNDNLPVWLMDFSQPDHTAIYWLWLKHLFHVITWKFISEHGILYTAIKWTWQYTYKINGLEVPDNMATTFITNHGKDPLT